MNENEIYTNSILTFVFTNEGRIVVRKDKEGKMDTLPWLFMGYREKDSILDYEDSIWVINNIDEYKERIAIFFSYHSKYGRNAVLKGFVIGNSDCLLDVGELHEKIATHQIGEMKSSNTTSYIRTNRGLYDGGTNQNGQQIVNRIETRYIVLPSDEAIEDFPDLEAKELDELKEGLGAVSDKIILGITGKDGQIMESFINQLKALNKSTSPGSPNK
ncbi:MAG: hypothetical protein K2J20_05065 [Bacilli bacterium]|nr:hypothetical protein [Bacilli bacterium]